MFPVEGIHDSVSGDHFQFHSSCYDHTDAYFHSEQGVNGMSDFSMHYENQDSYFVLPAELIHNFYVLGETNGSQNFISPQENVIKIKCTTEVKGSKTFRWPGAISCT